MECKGAEYHIILWDLAAPGNETKGRYSLTFSDRKIITVEGGVLKTEFESLRTKVARNGNVGFNAVRNSIIYLVVGTQEDDIP
jgi:hypothetical protein